MKGHFYNDNRERARCVAWLIADGGWGNALSEERDIAPLVVIDEDVPDGEIHVRLDDNRYYASTRTVELRIVKPLLRVWCPETGEVLASMPAKTRLSEEFDSALAPYVAWRGTGLSC